MMSRTWKDPITGVPVLSPGGTVFDITSLSGPNEPEGEPTHIVCCDPGTALCGADTVGQSIKAVHPGKSSDNPCKTCVVMDSYSAKCKEPKCPGVGPVSA